MPDRGDAVTVGPRLSPRAWLAIIGVSLAFRILAFVLLDGRAPDGDTPHYLAIARNILDGRGIVIDDPSNLTGMRAAYPPLYPLLLAALGLVLPLGMASVAALNTALDLLCSWLMAKLGRDLGQAEAGTLAAALYLVWPTHVGMAPLARKEGLIAVLVVALLLLLWRLARQPAPQPALAFGLVAGLLALAQPGLATLPAQSALAAIPFFPDGRRWARSMAVAAVAALAVLLPWWIRNALLFGRFVPLTTVTGYSLWIGATPLGDGTWLQPPARFRQGDELAMSAAMGKEARAIIAANPLDYFGHCLAKVWRAFTSEHRGVGQIHWAEPRAYLRVAQVWIAIAGAVHIAALIAAVARAATRRGEFLHRMLFAGFAQIILFGMWFEFDQRHRYFLTPIVLMVASQSVLAALDRRRRPAASAHAA